jgi:ABC-type branched-subunit amino acid transport system substrate-binding protein
MRRRLAMLSALSLVACVAACGGDNASDGASSGSTDPYVIGAAVDITGPFAATAAPKLEGFQLYFDWLNAKGGIDGHPVKIDVRDNKSDPAQAATNVRAFSNGDATAVFYGSLSASLGPYVQAMGDMPTLYGNVCYPPSTAPKPHPTFFCAGGSVMTDAMTFVELFSKIAKDPNNIKMGLVSADIPGCRYFHEDVMKKALEERGVEVVGVEIVPPAITDMDSVAGKLQRAGANGIIQYCLVNQMLALGESLKRIKWDGSYLVTLQHETTATGMEKAKYPNMYGIQSFSLPGDTPVWQDIKAAHAQFKPKLAVVDQRFGWANGMVLEKALRECGFPCEREKLVEVMNTLKMDDPKFTDLFHGELTWAPDRHVSEFKGYQISHWDESEQAIVDVLPEVYRVESAPMEAN